MKTKYLKKIFFVLALSFIIVLLLLYTFIRFRTSSKTYTFEINRKLTLSTNELPFDIYKNGKKLRLKRYCNGLSGKTSITRCVNGKTVIEETNILCGFDEKWCNRCSDIIEVKEVEVNETFEWDGTYFKDGWLLCGGKKYRSEIEKSANFGRYEVKVEGETVKEFTIPVISLN